MRGVGKKIKTHMKCWFHAGRLIKPKTEHRGNETAGPARVKPSVVVAECTRMTLWRRVVVVVVVAVGKDGVP